MRTPQQQTLIDVTGGWTLALQAPRMPVKRRLQAARELAGVYTALDALWPLTAYVDVWRWPVVGGVQHISVVAGVVQDSVAHARRGVGPAVDLPGPDGAPLQPFVEMPISATGYDAANGYWALWSWDGYRGLWQARYSHLPAEGVLKIGRTGDTTGGNVHICLWLNGIRVPPEDQPEFVALLE